MEIHGKAQDLPEFDSRRLRHLEGYNLKRSNYRIQDGCHTCGHVFVKGEYDDPNTYYCGLGAPKRPFCGSVAMGEDFTKLCPGGHHHGVPGVDRDTERDPWHVAYEAWEAWSKDREVDASGICDHHEPAQEAGIQDGKTV